MPSPCEESRFEVSALIKVFFIKVCLEYEDKGEVKSKERFTSDIDDHRTTKFVDNKVFFEVVVDDPVDCAGGGNSFVLRCCDDKNDDENVGVEVGANTE